MKPGKVSGCREERRNSLCVDGFMKGWVGELERIVQWRRELYFVCRLVFA